MKKLALIKKLGWPVMFAFIFSGCAVRDPIQMKIVRLRLVKIIKDTYASGNQLMLEWQTLDGKISIETTEPLKDSSVYHEGMIFPHCFLPK